MGIVVDTGGAHFLCTSWLLDLCVCVCEKEEKRVSAHWLKYYYYYFFTFQWKLRGLEKQVRAGPESPWHHSPPVPHYSPKRELQAWLAQRMGRGRGIGQGLEEVLRAHHGTGITSHSVGEAWTRVPPGQHNDHISLLEEIFMIDIYIYTYIYMCIYMRLILIRNWLTQ